MDKSVVLENLSKLLGKEFRIDDFCKTYNFEKKEFIKLFFQLEDGGDIEFALTENKAIRLISVQGKQIRNQDIQEDIYVFPKDIDLFNLTLFATSLEIELRIEFDKCMSNNEQIEKLKKMSEEEIKEYLQKRADFFAEENRNDLKQIEQEKKALAAKKLEQEERELKKSKLTPSEKKKLEEMHRGPFKREIKKIKKSDIDEDERKRKISIERQRNYLRYGVSETNKERFQRIEKEREQERLKKNEEYKLRLQYRKENVSNFSVGEVFFGEVVKVLPFGCFVDIGASDGFINISNLSNEDKKKFANKFVLGKKIKCEIVNIDLEKGNIDLIPTTKNMTKDPTKFEQKQTSIPKTITKNLTKETTKPKPNKTSIRKQKDNAKSIEQENLLLEKEKKEHERIDTVLENIIESGGKDTMKFFTRFITKNIKENNSEWSLTIPRNKKNTIRLYNNSLDGSYINDKGLMVVLMTPDEKSSADLKYLVDKHVSPKDRQGKYTKVPKAIPLFMTYDELKGTKKILYGGYCDFFEEARMTGANKWKKTHSAYAINRLSKILSLELSQPEYLNEK